jgi:hypothetical protein
LLDQVTRPQVRRPCAGRLLPGRDHAAGRGAASDLQRVWRRASRCQINVFRPRVLSARAAGGLLLPLTYQMLVGALGLCGDRHLLVA